MEKDLAQAGGEVALAQRREAETWIARLHVAQSRSSDEAARATGAGRAQTHNATAAGRGGTSGVGRKRLAEEKVVEVAAAVRGALKKAARERSPTSWSQLRRQLGAALPHLHTDDQLAVLVQVDADTPADEPLLSALLAVADSNSPSLYDQAARLLGRVGAGDAAAVRSRWQTDALHLQQLYRYR
jgi:hypothetical protein